MTQTIALSQLHRADGSATYSANGYSVIAAVNGPVEVQRRDELPEEAAIDVAIRPATGVGALPLHATLTSVLVAISQHGEFVKNPSPEVVRHATSLHVFSFESHGELLVSQSEGTFNIDMWEQVYDKAENICRGSSLKKTDDSDDVHMGSPETDAFEVELKTALRDKHSRDRRWREDGG
ncbi:MAG: hypothetical protein Q9183_004368 [Haloplaca sp. 2 TL-2023]